MRNEIITGVLVFIISTILGYHLNDYLSRDKITIQNVEVIPATKKYAIDQKKLAAIEDKSRGIGLFSSGGYLLSNFPDELNNSQLKWLKRQLNNKKVSAEIIKDKIKSAVNNVATMNDNASGEELLAVTDPMSIPMVYLDPKQTKKKDVLSALERMEIKLDDYIETIAQIVSDIDSFKSVRTGDFEVVVTLLNSGNTDGLIKYDGTMKIDTYKESIPIRVNSSSFLQSYGYGNNIPMYTALASIIDEKLRSTKIEKRSMVQISFAIDKDNGGGKIIGEIEQKVSKKESFEVSVQLVDFRGENIDSTKYRSYATD